jgi:hypothetical protein
MHLMHYCQGTSLLFHAKIGILPTKGSHEQMLSGSCPTTFQQQIKNFYLLRVNDSPPMMNTLHGMPSLLHLLWTQSVLENSNVHYSGFDIDLATPALADDQLFTIDNTNTITDPVIENCSFQRNTICLPMILLFKFICCHKQMNTEAIILKCLIKSLNASWNMLSMTMLIIPHCRYCHENNLNSC